MKQDQPFGWKSSLGGAESLGICRVGQTVLTRLMESRCGTSLPALWLCGRRIQRRDNGLCLPFERKLSPSSRLDARHFSSSPYATGAFQAAAPVLELRGRDPSESAGGSPCRRDPQGFLPPNPTHWVLQPEVMGTYLPGPGTLHRGA